MKKEKENTLAGFYNANTPGLCYLQRESKNWRKIDKQEQKYGVRLVKNQRARLIWLIDKTK